jgi:hypothetical protein
MYPRRPPTQGRKKYLGRRVDVTLEIDIQVTNLQLYIRWIKSPGLDYLRMKAKAI